MKKILKKIVSFILIKEVALLIKRKNPLIIAITGSVGKTTTKDMLHNLISAKYNAIKTPNNLNTDFGIALTILGRTYDKNRSNIHWIGDIFFGLKQILFRSNLADIYVLEIGTDTPGDIEHIVRNIHPDKSVLTVFPDKPVHLENFASKDEIYKEKANLIKYIKDNGTIIYNKSDKNINKYIELAPKTANKISIGFVDADVMGEGYEINYSGGKPIGIHFYITAENLDINIQMDGVLGMLWILPALITTAYGVDDGFSETEIRNAIESLDCPKGRMKLLDGVSGSVIIDDTYNSSPTAMNEALSTLFSIKTSGKKIAVLGDMLELGEESSSAHIETIQKAIFGVDVLILKGEEMLKAFRGINIENDVEVFLIESSKDIIRKVSSILKSGDIVLCKGSRSMKMEGVVAGILARKSDKRLTLVE